MHIPWRYPRDQCLCHRDNGNIKKTLRIIMANNNAIHKITPLTWHPQCFVAIHAMPDENQNKY